MLRVILIIYFVPQQINVNSLIFHSLFGLQVMQNNHIASVTLYQLQPPTPPKDPSWSRYIPLSQAQDTLLRPDSSFKGPTYYTRPSTTNPFRNIIQNNTYSNKNNSSIHSPAGSCQCEECQFWFVWYHTAVQPFFTW